MADITYYNFYNLSPEAARFPAHHTFLEASPERFEVFQELRAINPSTGRAYFDLGNPSDNVVHLQPSAGKGIPAVNGALVHAGKHPTYSALSRLLAEDVQKTYDDTFNATKDKPKALEAAAKKAAGYSNGTKALLTGGIDVSDLPEDFRLNGVGATSIFQAGNLDELKIRIEQSPAERRPPPRRRSRPAGRRYAP